MWGNAATMLRIQRGLEGYNGIDAYLRVELNYLLDLGVRKPSMEYDEYPILNIPIEQK